MLHEIDTLVSWDVPMILVNLIALDVIRLPDKELVVLEEGLKVKTEELPDGHLRMVVGILHDLVTVHAFCLPREEALMDTEAAKCLTHKHPRGWAIWSICRADQMFISGRIMDKGTNAKHNKLLVQGKVKEDELIRNLRVVKFREL